MNLPVVLVLNKESSCDLDIDYITFSQKSEHFYNMYTHIYINTLKKFSRFRPRKNYTIHLSEMSSNHFIL